MLNFASFEFLIFKIPRAHNHLYPLDRRKKKLNHSLKTGCGSAQAAVGSSPPHLHRGSFNTSDYILLLLPACESCFGSGPRDSLSTPCIRRRYSRKKRVVVRTSFLQKTAHADLAPDKSREQSKIRACNGCPFGPLRRRKRLLCPSRKSIDIFACL